MGKYDRLDKEYFAEPERLAELISVGVYHGRIRIMPEHLVPLVRSYPSLENVSGQMERDEFYFCKSHGMKYGLEIENYYDYSMPKRIILSNH